jgi:ribonuclease HI
MSGSHLLYADGASRGNPGAAAIGAVLYAPGDPDPVVEISEAIGTATNNVAEYRAVIAGLDAAVRLGVERLVVRLDSQLLVRQMAGEYKVRAAALKPLHRRAVELLRRVPSAVLEHVPREENRVADALANAALDR